MRSIQVAEWILGLSMTRERAEAVAGDLREAERGSFWFWRTVVATMIASVWSDVRSEWWKMAAVALAINVTWFALEMFLLGPVLAQSVPRYERLNLALNWAQMFFPPFWAARFFPRREIASWFAGSLALLLAMAAFAAWMWPNVHVTLGLPLMPLDIGLAAVILARRLPRLVFSK